jgi:hypothetical protein
MSHCAGPIKRKTVHVITGDGNGSFYIHTTCEEWRTSALVGLRDNETRGSWAARPENVFDNLETAKRAKERREERWKSKRSPLPALDSGAKGTK